MKIKFVLICFFISIFLISIVSAEENFKITSINANETVHAVVMLREQPKLEAKFGKFTRATSSVNADVGKSAVENAKELGIENVSSFSSIDAFSGTFNSSDIEMMVSSGKFDIYRPIPLHAAMQNVVNIDNASASWLRGVRNINLTGKGQTICIIDTGVNYTHPDLGGCFGAGCKVIGGWDFVNGDNNPMDDNGHGTHVSGIAAANGTLTGIAPEANLVVIKALDSGGSGNSIDVAKAIDWCVTNSSLYNISVISMSLAADCNNYPSLCFASYCDGMIGGDTILASLNAAVAKNITVVMAAGNNNNWTALPYPSCYRNATAITAFTKNDGITNYANRDSNVQLGAIGGDNSGLAGHDVNSTWFNGGYYAIAGTSMATPQIAGAVAIIRQLLLLTNQYRTSAQIVDTLNATGKPIYDNKALRTYSRLNIYSAISSLTLTNVTLNYSVPAVIARSLLNLSCNASSMAGLSNITIFVWNSTGIRTTILNNVSGTFNSTLGLITLSDGGYNWSCEADNILGEKYFAVSNLSLTVDLTPPQFLLVSPRNMSSLNSGRFNVTLEDLGNCSYSLNGNKNITMNTTDNVSFFSYNNTLSPGNYLVQYFCMDSAGNSNMTSRLNFTIDNSSFIVNTSYPSSGFTVTGSTSIGFNFTVNSTLNMSSCSLYLNNVLNAVNGSSISLINNNTITSTVDPGNYNWFIGCINEAETESNSSASSFSINSPPSGGGGSSSGGGGSGGAALQTASNEYVVDNGQIVNGVSESVSAGDRIKWIVNGTKNNSIVINSFSNDSVKITLANGSIQISINKGQTITIAENVKLTYDGIVNGKAEIMIKSESQPSTTPNKPIEPKNQNESGGEPETANGSFSIGVYALIALAIVAIALISIRFHKGKKIGKIKKETMASLYRKKRKAHLP